MTVARMNTWLCLMALTAFQDVVPCNGLLQNCPNHYEVWFPDGDYCYFSPSIEYVYYHEAQNLCLELNSNMISLHSFEQEEAIRAKLFEPSSHYHYYWLGISRTDGREWSWMDGSTVDYVNWGTDPEVTDDCAYLHKEEKYWVSVQCATSSNHVLCQAAKSQPNTTTVSTTSSTESAHPSTTTVSTASSTVSSPTTEPDVLSCSLFSRGQCQNDQEDSIAYTKESDPVDCQNLCSGIYFNECKSFSFNFHSGLCTLKSSTIQAQDQCLQLGGPRFPLISTCQAKGCQDFYHTDCDASALSPIDTIENVGNPSECQMLCQNHHLECAHWRLERQQCHLYYHAESCNVLNGPSDLSLEECT